MARIDSQVLETFLERLSEADEVTDAVADGLRTLLSSGKLPKADDVAELFASGSGDTLA